MQTAFEISPGVFMPSVGFGTYGFTGDVATKAVMDALDTGYRLIDTADAYENHVEIGRALKETTVPRKDIFITTKLWWTDLKKEHVIENTYRFLEELGTAYIDLLLIHYPSSLIKADQTFEGLQQLKQQGLIRAFGVSNFTKQHLQEVLDVGYKPDNCQLEFHPSFMQEDLVGFCRRHDISLTAYSPLGQGKDLELPLIKNLAEKHQKSPAQIILSWILSKNISVIPKALDKKFMGENLDMSNWQLNKDDIVKIDNIPQGKRLVEYFFSEF